MLNCLKGYKRCIHISQHILDFVHYKKTRFTMEQPFMLPILYCQYHSCWCPGYLRNQGISRHGIDQISWNIPSLASEDLSCYLDYAVIILLRLFTEDLLLQFGLFLVWQHVVREQIFAIHIVQLPSSLASLKKYSDVEISGETALWWNCPRKLALNGTGP